MCLLKEVGVNYRIVVSNAIALLGRSLEKEIIIINIKEN